jgi:Cu+-exporting ATPase
MSVHPVLEEVHCYHCDEVCEKDQIITHDDHSFCCTGCKNVYQILQEADLCDFYSLEEKTGRVRSGDHRKYLVLDNPEIAAEFIEFDHEGLVKTSFQAPNIHCSSCIWLLEHLNRIDPGILKSSVNFLKKEVTVWFYKDKVSMKEIAGLLDSVGYPPAIVLSKQRQRKKRNSLAIPLAVAGFCFGNSMLLSIPDYLDLNYQIPESYRSIFAYINLLFALPVFFYSANVYFISAIKGLKHRFVNIDVPISIGIVTLFLRSAYEIVWLGEMGYVDSLAGLVFFLLIGRGYQNKTYQALSFDRDFSSYFPIAVTKLDQDSETSVRIQDLKIGDTILVRNQELIQLIP